MYDHVLLPTATRQSIPTEVAELLLSSTISYIASATLSRSAASSVMTTEPSNGTSGGESRPGAENGECKLLGPFALFVQGALGLLALLSLVFKRWRERPQRPVKIWAFDASKQVVGSALLHVANLLMSMLSSGELTIKANHYQANPCSFYLLNLAIDVGSVSHARPCSELMVLTFLVDYDRNRYTRCTPPLVNLCLLPHSSG